MSSKYLQMDNRICLERQNKRKDQITELILDHCQAPRLNGLTSEYVNLEALSIINVGLETLEGFPRLPKLRKLELCDNKITGGLNSLHGCPNLQDLNLAGNTINDFNALEPLKNFQALSNLDIFNCEISKTTNYREKVLDILPNLQKLDGFDRCQKGLVDSDRSEDDDTSDGIKMDHQNESINKEAETMDVDKCNFRNSSTAEKMPDNDAKTNPPTVSIISEHQEDVHELTCSPKKASEEVLTTIETEASITSGSGTLITKEPVEINQSLVNSDSQLPNKPLGQESSNEETVKKKGEAATLVVGSQAIVEIAETFQSVEGQLKNSNLDATTFDANDETAEEADLKPLISNTSEVVTEKKQQITSVQVDDNEMSTIADLTPMQASSVRVDSVDGVEPDSAGIEAENWDQHETCTDESEIKILNMTAHNDSDDSKGEDINIHSSRERSDDEEEEEEEEDDDIANDVEAEGDCDEDEDDEEQDDDDDDDDDDLYNENAEGENVDEDLSQLNDPYCGYSSPSGDELEEGEYLDNEDEEEIDEDEDESNNRTVELVESDEEEEESKEE